MKFQMQFRHRHTGQVLVIGEGNFEDFHAPDGNHTMEFVNGLWRQALDDKILGNDGFHWDPWMVTDDSPGSGFVPRDANGYLIPQEVLNASR